MLALELGINDAQLRTVAEQLDDNWDRVRRPDGPRPEPPALDLRPLLEAGRALLAASVGVGVTDKLAVYLQGWLPGWLEEVEDLAGPGSTRSRSSTCCSTPSRPRPAASAAVAGPRPATAARWRPATRRRAWSTARSEGSALAAMFDPVIEAVLGRLGDELARFTLAEAERRSRSGRLTFHDLLVLCRRLVRHPTHGERVRVELAQRYQALLLDEYQDTDPLQLDIVLAIATPPGADLPPPGQLFFVGDPKQSLYRFRRADIDLFLRTPDRGRRRPGLAHDELPRDAAAHPLDQPRLRPADHRTPRRTTGSWRSRTSRPWPPCPRPELAGSARRPSWARSRTPRRRGSACCGRRRRRTWRRRSTGSSPRDGRSGPAAVSRRPARRSDIAILIPARTALGQLEAALRASGIAVPPGHGLPRLRGGRGPGPAAWPCASSTTRRTSSPWSAYCARPLYGCSDVDLYRWRVQRGGRWNPPRPAARAAGGRRRRLGRHGRPASSASAPAPG